MFIERIKEYYQTDEPIFTSDLLDMFKEYSRAYVFRMIKKAEKDGELVKFDKGVYYIPHKTFFGISTISADMVARRKYIEYGDDVFGIYSGIKLLNMFSVITLVPNTIELVTNNESTRCRKVIIDGMTYILRKSRVKITKENMKTYLILQLFTDMYLDEKLDVYAKNKIIKFMQNNGVTKKKLFDLASKFPSRGIKNLFKSGVLDDVA